MNALYYKIYNININIKKQFIEDDIENYIIDFNKLKYNFNIIKNIDSKNFKYLNQLYFLITNVKNEDIYQEKRTVIIVNDNSYNIIKNKFIFWPKNDTFFFFFFFLKYILYICFIFFYYI